MSALIRGFPTDLSALTPDPNHEILARLVEIMASGDGDLVAFLECYFDESGSHEGSPVLCVAGYLFDKEQCKILDLKWKEVLDRYQLPYFRMSACAHLQKPFDHLSRQQSDDVEREMIQLINEYALLGVAIAVNEHDYSVLFEGKNPAGSAYSFCCVQVLAGINAWIMRNQFRGEIAYFFEAGHESASEANAVMNRIFQHPNLHQRYCYAAHAFVDKVKVRPVQTADILAWHQATQVKRWLKNNHEIRADFRALAVKPRHELFIGSRENLGGVIAYQRWVQGLPVYNGITGRYGASWFWCPFRGQAGLVIGQPSRM